MGPQAGQGQGVMLDSKKSELENSTESFEPGLHFGPVSVLTPAWEKGMSVDVVVAKHIHRG